MSIPSQLFLSGNVSWADEEHGKNSSLYLNRKYDQNSAINVTTSTSTLTIMIVILTMALIVLVVAAVVKTRSEIRRGEHSNDIEMDNVNEDNVPQTTFPTVETDDYFFYDYFFN